MKYLRFVHVSEQLWSKIEKLMSQEPLHNSYKTPVSIRADLGWQRKYCRGLVGWPWLSSRPSTWQHDSRSYFPILTSAVIYIFRHNTIRKLCIMTLCILVPLSRLFILKVAFFKLN